MEEENILEFGIKRENEERRDGGFAIVFDPKIKLFAVGKHFDDNFFRFFSGGVEDGEDIEAGTLREVTEESGLYDFLHVEKIGEAMVHYFNSLKNVNRVALASCFLVVLKSGNLIDTKLEEHEKFDLVWVKAEEIIPNWQNTRDLQNQPQHWIYFFGKSIERLKELGYLD